MLFRGTSEHYNPQVHTEELSLTTQMDKDMAVHNSVISRFERYNKFTSFLFHTGRVDGGTRAGWIKRPSADKEVHDNAYRVQYRSLEIKPAYSMNSALFGGWHEENNPSPDMTGVVGVTYTGTANANNIVTDVLFSIAIKHDPTNDIYGGKMNPQDSFVLNAGLGTVLWIIRKREASTGDHFVYDGKVIGQATDFDAGALAEDNVLMEGGNYVGEGSTRGYQRYGQSYWEIFYAFQSRYTLTFTGNSMRQRKIIWTSNQNSASATKTNGYWQYEEEWRADQYFAIFLEMACRFSATSMDASTHSWFENFGKNLLTSSNMNPEAGLTPPRTPDGWVRQIKDTIDMSYDVNTGLSPYLVEAIMNVLSNNSPAGAENNEFIILGDAVAYDNWDRCMKLLSGWNVANGGAVATNGHNTRIVKDITGGADVELGFNVKTYHYKYNTIRFIQDELFSHPGLNNRNGGLVGNGNMYILNVTPFEGVSNFELFSGGNGRFFRKKYVDGLHSLDPSANNSTKAASGFDGAMCHYLAELFPVCYVKDTCAVLRGDGAYAGGGLAGNTALPNFPTIK